MGSDTRRVVITGLGAVSPFGTGVGRLWDALCAGESGIRAVTGFDTSEHRFHHGGEVVGFEPSVPNTPRAVAFALAAIQECITQADLTAADPRRVGLATATNFGSADLMGDCLRRLHTGEPVDPRSFAESGMQADADRLAAEMGIAGPRTVHSLACATGNCTIGWAADRIRSGRSDIMMAVGYDILCEYTWTALGSLGIINNDREAPDLVRPFDLNRKGTLFSEGSAAVLLESEERARRRGANVLCELLGHAANNNAHHMTHADPEGAGTAEVMRTALADARVSPDEIDHVNSHATGTPVGDPLEVLAIRAALGSRAGEIPINALKSSLGHLMGAAGSIEAAAAVLTIVHGVIPPTINYETADPDCQIDCVPNEAREAEVATVLSNSAGIGGTNSAIVLGRYSP